MAEDFNTKPEQAGEIEPAEPAKVYSVRFLPDSPRTNRLATRRRGGLVIGRDRLLVSTAAGEGVQQVDAAGLEAILGDQRLIIEEVGAPQPAALFKPEEPEEPTSTVETAPTPKRRGRPPRKK